MTNELPLYQVVDYDRIFENFRSRVVDRCAFVCKPNKHGGGGWSSIMSQPDGAAIYGIWSNLVEMLSRQKRPRQGYLTADGTREGWRFSTAQLSHMFRRPQSEIRRCLHVVSSPQVGWLILVEGKPDDARSDTDSIDEKRYHDYRPESIPAVSISDDARRDEKEGRKEVLSVQDPVTFAEAKRILNRISERAFNKPLRDNQWCAKWEYALNLALPFPRIDFELIERFYALPDKHELFQVTLKRASLGALIENLKDEPQKIRSALRTLRIVTARTPGRNGAPPKLEEPEKVSAVVFAMMKKLYGPEAPVPFYMKDLAPSVRTEILETIKNESEATQPNVK